MNDPTGPTPAEWGKGLSELLSRNSRRYFGAAYGILRDTAAAEDACQQAMLKAWRERGKLQDERALHAWVLRVVVNESLQTLRKRKTERRVLARISPGGSIMGAAPGGGIGGVGGAGGSGRSGGGAGGPGTVGAGGGDGARSGGASLAAYGVGVPGIDPQAGLDALGMREAVLEALETLEEPTRTIVVLRVMQGLSGNEVKAELGCSASEVSRRLHDGMEKLRPMLVEWRGQRGSLE